MPLAVRAQGKVNGIVLEASGPASRHDGVGYQYGSKRQVDTSMKAFHALMIRYTRLPRPFAVVLSKIFPC